MSPRLAIRCSQGSISNPLFPPSCSIFQFPFPGGISNLVSFSILYYLWNLSLFFLSYWLVKRLFGKCGNICTSFVALKMIVYLVFCKTYLTVEPIWHMAGQSVSLLKCSFVLIFSCMMKTMGIKDRIY